MPIRILTYFFILVLSGCGPSSPVKENKPAVVKKLIKSPNEKTGVQLSTIQADLKNNKLNNAIIKLQKLDISQSYGLEIPVELVRIKIDLEKKRVVQALRRLKTINPSALPMPLQIEYYQLHAQALNDKGHRLEAARLWVALNHLETVKMTKIESRFWQELGVDLLMLFPAQSVEKNNQLLWQSLKSVKSLKLRQVKQISKDIFSGWVALALLERTSLQQGINNWRLRFKNHPGEQVITVTPPSLKKIALILPPLSTPFGAAGEAIKNGFSAASQADKNKKRPEIAIHFANVSNISAVYQKAVDEGVDVVVGPLRKETIKALLSVSQLPVPTLALNILKTRVFIGNLYQFGLSPEDEAREIVKRAWADGHRSAGILVPDGLWGKNILDTFKAEWEDFGGNITIKQMYGGDFHSSIPLAFQEIEKTDMVFMVALPQHASTILQFLRPNNKPIYSISRIYAGTPNPQRDAGLEGVIFVDMPWVLDEENKLEKYNRLYALGIDAYNLLPKLQNFRSLQWQGYTGHLSVNQNGVIHRNQLPFARFVDGKPQILK